MNNILVIFTGGTIGSMKQGTAIDVRAAGSYVLLNAYNDHYTSGDVNFTTLQPLNILSENVTPEHWKVIVDNLNIVDLEQYDGIIITHGSDTLAYSANMLGLLLQHLSIPVFLVASNYPIGDSRANGLRNFAAAVALIKQDMPANVYVVYENNKQEMQVYLATRIMQCETFTDQFRSPYELTLGQFVDGRMKWHEHPLNPSEEELRARKPKALNVNRSKLDKNERPVVYIKPYPGLNYHLYQWNADNKPAAIIHDLYHSGTACASAEERYSLTSFIKRAAADQVPVYLAPVRDAKEAIYASTGMLVEAGAILLEGISIEALMCKLQLAEVLYENDEQQKQQFVQASNVNFEWHKVQQ